MLVDTENSSFHSTMKEKVPHQVVNTDTPGGNPHRKQTSTPSQNTQQASQYPSRIPNQHMAVNHPIRQMAEAIEANIDKTIKDINKNYPDSNLPILLDSQQNRVVHKDTPCIIGQIQFVHEEMHLCLQSYDNQLFLAKSTDIKTFKPSNNFVLSNNVEFTPFPALNLHAIAPTSPHSFTRQLPKPKNTILVNPPSVITVDKSDVQDDASAVTHDKSLRSKSFKGSSSKSAGSKTSRTSSSSSASKSNSKDSGYHSRGSRSSKLPISWNKHSDVSTTSSAKSRHLQDTLKEMRKMRKELA